MLKSAPRPHVALVILCCLIVVSGIFIASPCIAQESAPEKQERPRRALPPENQGEADEVLRIDTDLVTVDVAVADEAGQPVRNLRAEDFKLYEDGTERPIAFYNVEKRGGLTRPVAIVFALDVSGSMTAEEMERLQSAMNLFSKRLSVDRSSLFAVMTFGMNVKTLQSFTADGQKLARAFERLPSEPNGLSTHTYDAVDDAIRLLVRHAPRTRERRLMKRAVVVVTDGFPVGDTVSASTVIERANAADVSVYTVTLPSFSRMLVSTERVPLPTPLDVSGLTEKTGGTSVYATDRDFDPLFRALAEEVTSAYVLAFYPPEEKRHDGRFHTIHIEAPRGLIVRQSRPGYKSSDK
ncbi:MAG: Ca-activated chloride channel [Acidobacteriota bacterium]|jgi:VWFA-related protein|nr:Ca-activated chloride channel [Acidobacteriota bacterium]